MQLRLEVQADGESVFGFYGDGNALLKPDADLVEKIRHLLLTGVQYLANAAKLPDGVSLPRDSSHVDAGKELNNVVAPVIGRGPA